jgi:hypothetical protein
MHRSTTQEELVLSSICRTLALVALILTGCAVTLPNPAVPPDPEATASIYAYKVDSGIGGAAVDFYLYVDDVAVARLNTGDNVRVQIRPGRHQVYAQSAFAGMSSGSPKYRTAVELSRGEDVYLRFSVGISGTRPSPVGTTLTFKGGLELVPREVWQSRL